MNISEQKGAGLALIIGSILMITTMVLHPVGGGFDQLLKIVTIGIVSHSIGILSIPFVAYGFWGLSNKLKEESFLSRVGFSIMFLGLIAAMIAAAMNGLILTDFVESYEGASEETIDSIKPFFVFMRSFNHAFDFIFIGAVCLSILMWSIAILKTKAIVSWVGYVGLVISIGCLVIFASGFELVDLFGFRLFIFSSTAWIISAGYQLLDLKKAN